MRKKICNSLNKMQRQEIFATVVAKARYLASVEERDKVLCFLADHEIGKGPRNKKTSGQATVNGIFSLVHI